MDSKLSLGLFIGFILTGASLMIGPSQCAGISVWVLTAIWGFLFVYPKSPVRKYWWSVSGKLGVVHIRNVGITNRDLTIFVGFRAVSVIQIDKIVLKIGRKQLLSDWEPRRVKADESCYIKFTRQNWLCAGEYNVRVIAYTPDGFSKSEKFPLTVDS